jgi:hypothetical protein
VIGKYNNKRKEWKNEEESIKAIVCCIGSVVDDFNASNGYGLGNNPNGGSYGIRNSTYG